MPFAVGIGCALEAADRVFPDQAITVDAHEAPQKLLLELRQRFLEQKLALGGTHRHVLELGLEEYDAADRYQMNAAALIDR
jgi:hypothetical protein